MSLEDTPAPFEHGVRPGRPIDPFELTVLKTERLLDVEQYGEAERSARAGLAIAPDRAHAYVLLARALVGLERWEEAEDAANEAAAREPQDPWVHVLRGQIQAEQGRHVEAEAAFLEALRLDPREPWCYVAYAQLLLKTGHLRKAREGCDLALSLDPNLPAAHRLKSLLEGERGRHASAAKHSGHALALEPGEANSHVIEGIAHLRSGRALRARAAFREALRQAPDVETEELFLEADKASRWIYRPFYHWSLIVDRVFGGPFAVWGLFMVLVGLSRALPEEHWGRIAAGWILIVYMGFVIYTWIAGLLVRAWIRWVPPKI
jgi:tetratricopeptide (TPR) repeat protein